MLRASHTPATSALIPFVPRQVMLHSKFMAAVDDKQMEKESKKKMKKSKSKPSETLENGSNDLKTLLLNGGAAVKNRQRLVSSIAAFLDSNGFHKTLSVFRTEANIETDGMETSSIDLEGMFGKFLESRGHEEAMVNGQEEKDIQKAVGSSKDESEHANDVSDQVRKKKKKHRKEHDDGTDAQAEEYGLNKDSNGLNSVGDINDLEKLKFVEDLHAEIKDKKKKKKSAPVSLEEDIDKKDLGISGGIAKDGETNDKAKKKKKHKMTSDGHEENAGSEDHKKSFQDTVEEKIAELKSLANIADQPAESNAKHKGEKKKKKKTEATSDSIPVDENMHSEETWKESESVKEKTAKSEDDGNIGKKAYKKRKRLGSEERALQEENGTEAKESKRDKLEDVEHNMEGGTPKKPDKALVDSECITISKKQKTERSIDVSVEVAKASHQEEDPGSQDVQKESGANQLANGELEKSKKEMGTASKSKKKEKHSAEPKTVNAFQRVKIDEIKFADERLQDNSYWALDNTGSGYGAKAQEVLGQVKGRDFRHEKTKKKRGTYRGGHIDLQSHSIKFNYSDEE